MTQKLFKTILLSLVFSTVSLYAQEGFSDIFGVDKTEEKPLETNDTVTFDISGNVGCIQDFFFDKELSSERIARPFASLNIHASAPSVQAKMDLRIKDIGDFSIAELYLRGFFSFGYFDSGFIKKEWGKGDGVHVIDPLNPLDQSAGISSDLNEMKKAEFMLAWNQYLGENALLEIVYKPFYTPLITSTEGRWVIADISLFPDIQPPPNTKDWKYTQLATRLSGSFLRIDAGLLYYYGYFSEPGAQIITKFTGSNPMDPADYTTSTHWTYTKAQLVGAEAVGVLGPFTLRGEMGYWFSEDRTGTIEHLYNDRLVWLGGIDYLLGSNFFISVQEYGHYIMNYTNATAQDVNRGLSYKNQASLNNLILAIEGTFFNEQLKLRLSGLTLLGTKGYVLMPEISWFVTDNWEIALKGKLFDGEKAGNNPYYAWKNNDSLSLLVSFTF
ncbi:MAG TPA: hypothetical protein VFC68_02585 [Treponemataceae bacterium]|nr:hypothetical protein [Treponemataceae bacterium]